MKEIITTPDGMKLTAKYRVAYQDRLLKQKNKCMFVWNPKKAGMNMSVQNLFDTAEEAMAELAKVIRKNNRGARIETTDCGGIGIDLVISEEDAKEHEIIRWEIQKQWRSDWDVVESA